jgi:hypothetical protein
MAGGETRPFLAKKRGVTEEVVTPKPPKEDGGAFLAAFWLLIHAPGLDR